MIFFDTDGCKLTSIFFALERAWYPLFLSICLRSGCCVLLWRLISFLAFEVCTYYSGTFYKGTFYKGNFYKGNFWWGNC